MTPSGADDGSDGSRKKKPKSNRLSGAMAATVLDVAPPQERHNSLASLHALVSPEELYVVFQPIVSMHDGSTFAYEALVRCTIDKYRSPPALFEAAAHHHCTGRLGRMIRETGIPFAGGKPLFVNIHPDELNEGWLIRPDDPIYRHDDEIYLEVTESVPLTHFDLCMQVLREVGSRGGVHLVVDDLGAGYSNLLRIADLEPRVVKLDRALIMGIDHKPRQLELVSAVVDLCTRLGARVVAEGIETLDELLALKTTGVHYAQGFKLARPAFPPPEVDWPL